MPAGNFARFLQLDSKHQLESELRVDDAAVNSLPVEMDSRGEIGGFVPVPIGLSAAGAWPPDGSQVSDIVQLDVYTKVTNTGNSTAYLVPPEGVVVLSDINDVLRVTKI